MRIQVHICTLYLQETIKFERDDSMRVRYSCGIRPNLGAMLPKGSYTLKIHWYFIVDSNILKIHSKIFFISSLEKVPII